MAKEFYFTNLINTKIVEGRFLNDPYEIKSRVVRAGINQRLLKNDLKVKRYPFFIKDAQSWIKKHDKEILISGDDKFITLSFKRKSNFSLAMLNNNYKYADLILIEDLENLKIPYEPAKATVSYITSLLYKLNDDKFKLKQIITQNFRWENNSHLAYPLFLLGNYDLKDYAKNQNKIFLECAIKNYKKALNYIQAKNNPETYFAIVNNLMVAYYMKYLNTAKLKYKQIANTLFKKNFTLNQKIKSKLPTDMRLSFIENKLIIGTKLKQKRKNKKVL